MKVIVKRKLLEAGVTNAVIEDIDDAISEYPDPISGIRTAYLQEKFFKDHFHYVVSLYTKFIPGTLACIINGFP